jgi:transitional endoplasmic reticulum ATPase
MDRSHPLSVQLQAAPARSEDAGSNVVRLPVGAFDVLGLEEGDPVEVEGSRTSVWRRAMRAHPDDEGIGVARLVGADGELHELDDGGSVRVRAAVVRPAVELEVLAHGPEDLSVDGVREALERQAVLLLGDRLRLELQVHDEGFDLDLGLVGLSLLQVVGRKALTEGASVRIVASVPEGPVRVVPDTELRLTPA